jgi:hypothetical protein
VGVLGRKMSTAALQVLDVPGLEEPRLKDAERSGGG